MDSRRITELRREIEAIEELNKIYRARKHHRDSFDQTAYERRLIRLEEIKQELAACRPKKMVSPRKQ